MTTAGPSIPTRVAAGLLATIILATGCVSRAFVFPEHDQSPAQLAKDQAECMAEAKKNADTTEAVGRGLGTTLIGSIAGAIVGAGFGALIGFGVASAESPSNPTDAGLIIGGGAGVGAVIGWFVGTAIGVKTSARQAQDLVDDAFQRCMKRRGYTVGRER